MEQIMAGHSSIYCNEKQISLDSVVKFASAPARMWSFLNPKRSVLNSEIRNDRIRSKR
jgi:hypothetical protein